MSVYYNPYEEDTVQPPRQPDEEPAELAADPAEPTRRQRPRRPKPARSQSRTAQIDTALIGTRTKMFIGVAMIILAGYMLISVISMLMHPGADQIAVQYNTTGQIVSTGTPVSNSGGPAGAKLSNFLITSTLGLGSLVVIAWLVAVGLRLGGWIKLRFWPFTLKALILTVTVSIVVGLITYPAATPLRLGGDHGYYVNHTLIKYASPIGAICVSVALVALVAIIFMTQITMAIAAYRRKVKALKAAHAARLEKIRTDKRKVDEQMATSAVDQQDEEAQTEEAAAGTDNDDEENPADGQPDEEPISLMDATDEPAEDEPEDKPAPPAGTEAPDEPDNGFEITTNEIETVDHVSTDTYDPTAELSHYHFPPIDLLKDYPGSGVTVDTEEQEANKQRIIDALAQFRIEITSIKATVGPTITLFEVVPAPGQRIVAIKRVEEDLALALKAKGIRIIAPIPGKGTIGIEVPNSDPQVVPMRTIIASKKFQDCRYELPMALGATISNDVFIADLAKMPHLLVAGATGQGKSVGLNAIITSLLYKKHPAELKFVLVDPKMVEFSLYRVLERHYLAKLPDEEEAVITDCNKVVATLNSLCVEMDNRYKLLSSAGCRGIGEYNQKFISKRLNPEKGHRFMPYIVVIIDEFADLIMQAGKEVEVPLCRIAQKARAVGIHAIIATQRPSTNVITGLIKAQFPGRIAFRVAQMVDSKTILDRTGAHQLIGKGDMFFSTNGNIERVQCAFVDTPEVEAICECISEQQAFPSAYELPEYIPDLGGDGGGAAMGGNPGSPFDRDPLFEEAARFIVTAGNTASTSSLQRRYNIGYNRAGRLMDQLEAAGIVGPAFGSKPRNVLVDPMTLDSMLGI